MALLFHILGWTAFALALVGLAYTLAAVPVVGRFLRDDGAPHRRTRPASVLKPLHGAEPCLAENLATFLPGQGDAPVQLLCGIQDPADPARAAVATLPLAELVVDRTRHGANAKVANLANMAPRIAHALVVMSDSDIAVAPDYLDRIDQALAAPGVGAVTCLYRGRGDTGFWSRLCAAGIDWQFLPGAAFGIATGLARPCMGSTIAMERTTLARIGGFAAFADVLADDYAIGAAVRALGLKVAVPRMLVVHACDETGFGALWRHELRWAATVREVEPIGHAASVVGYPFPLALVALALSSDRPAALALLLATLAARLALVGTIARAAGARPAPVWLLPFRDILSFAVFFASFFVSSVDWRGGRLRMGRHGRISADPEPSP